MENKVDWLGDHLPNSMTRPVKRSPVLQNIARSSFRECKTISPIKKGTVLHIEAREGESNSNTVSFADFSKRMCASTRGPAYDPSFPSGRPHYIVVCII